MIRRLILVITIGLLMGPSIAAQSGGAVTAELRKTANEAYQKQDWKTAAGLYARIVEADKADPGTRYRYGIALLHLNRNTLAADQLRAAFDASPNSVFALALARAYARLNKDEQVYEVLDRIVQLGGVARASLESEDDLSRFRGQPRFVELVRTAELAADPCKAGPEFRQLDFWIGEWNAVNAQGVVVGTSSVQLILGDCVIFENWNTPVSSGKSFNVYDRNDGKWHQSWVDARGTRTHYVGEFKDGRIVMIAETVSNGKRAHLKMTFSSLPDGSVRQVGESSSDGGKTWSPRYEFTYIRQ